MLIHAHTHVYIDIDIDIDIMFEYVSLNPCFMLYELL